MIRLATFCLLLLLSLATPLVWCTTLAMALDADPVSLDPHEQLSEATLQFSHLAYDPLLRWTQDNQFEPRLATHWQKQNQNTTRFYLRPNVVFHSGNEFSAKDVVFTINRLKQSSDFRAMFAAIDRVETIDKYTIDIITRSPTPLLLNILTYVFPMDAQYFAGRDEIVKYGETFASKHISGTGPFILTAREPGTRMEFQRFQNYWDKQSKGNVSRLLLTPISSGPSRLAALLSGGVDLIYPVSPLDIPRIQATENMKVVTVPSTRILLLHLDQQRRAEFLNPNVRQAINLAIDQRLIVEKVLKGYGEAAGQLSAKDYLGHLDSLKPAYDLQRAKALMSQAGYSSGFRVSMMAPNNRYVHDEKIAQAIVNMLAKINIIVDLKTLPKAQYFQEFDRRSADIMMLGWLSDTNDSNNLFEFLIACPDATTGFGAYNASHYCNPSITTLIEAANRELHPDRRQRLLQRIEQIVADDAAIIPLHWQHHSYASVKNVGFESVIHSQNFPYLGDLIVD